MGECPPCKIIIDGRVLAGSARLFAAQIAAMSGLPKLIAASEYLAAIVDGATEALIHGTRAGLLEPAELDEAHAMSELSCHRAAWLRDAAIQPRMTPTEQDRAAKLLVSWAEELRLHSTKLIGGEYHGAWDVNGIVGISRKGE
jgi:hypothetical protein